MQSYGFVGAGEIAAAIVEGLGTGVTDPPPVVLSPRNHDVAHNLAARFPNVRVCGSNQEVLDAAEAIVVAVRPQVAQEVLAQLAFRPEHVVVSAVAGVGLAQLREWVSPAGRIVRSIPLPTAARAASRTAMFPDDAVARALFESVGDVVVPGDEPTLNTFSAATSTFAAHLDQLATIASWMAEHGVGPEDADAYVAHVYGELGRTLSRHDGTLGELAGKHMTPGGINEQFLAGLRRDGVPDLVRRGLDDVLARVKGQ
jgi:pyrroline-5-carboxylate reductase